ncbi:MAG: hypothetical protein V3T21_04655 [Candidatus Margulisiibacteriota bacterium]
MARGSKRKKAQQRVLNEIQHQLVLQAERWGRKDHYTPMKLEEMVLGQCYKIKGDFYGERANLEYELQRIGTDKKECLIKLEKLEGYLKKADRGIKGHRKAIARILDKMVGDKEKVLKVLGKTLRKPAISLMLGEN